MNEPLSGATPGSLPPPRFGASVTDQDFAFVRKLLQERTAILLEDSKRYLVETRLAPLVRQMRLGSIGELVQRLRSQPSSDLQTQVIEALLTTETSFFRDPLPFESLGKVVLPDLVARRRDERRLNIWCAACSTGQEPYSLVLLLREQFPELAGWEVRLLATDMSQEVLARAREGRYSQLEVERGLPAALLTKYFRRQGNSWQIDEECRRRVDFRELNLVQPWPLLPRLDLVLLRNVMIYFDVPVKKDILGRLARLMRPDGYLLLGGAETTLNLDDSYRRVEHLRSGFYQLIG